MRTISSHDEIERCTGPIGEARFDMIVSLQQTFYADAVPNVDAIERAAEKADDVGARDHSQIAEPLDRSWSFVRPYSPPLPSFSVYRSMGSLLLTNAS